jgi:hypothetical protein
MLEAMLNFFIAALRRQPSLPDLSQSPPVPLSWVLADCRYWALIAPQTPALGQLPQSSCAPRPMLRQCGPSRRDVRLAPA